MAFLINLSWPHVAAHAPGLRSGVRAYCILCPDISPLDMEGRSAGLAGERADWVGSRPVAGCCIGVVAALGISYRVCEMVELTGSGLFSSF